MKIQAVKFSEPLAPVDESTKQHISKVPLSKSQPKHSTKFIFPYDL